MAYRDLRHYLEYLEERGKLVRIAKEVDKDWEIAAVCRVAFQSIREKERPALLFENVKGFDVPVAVGLLGASPEIYAMAMETTVEGIADTWRQALRNPIAPKVVTDAPCQEMRWIGEEADITRLPVPIWSAGEDPGPYMTSPYVCTKHASTGQHNVGTYRIQVKGKNRLGIFAGRDQDFFYHLESYRGKAETMPVAIALGTEPALGLVSVAKVPKTTDEYTIAGALRGEPIEIVKALTTDLEVPASAEIIIEGVIPLNELEMEGPFGEYTGYMGVAGLSQFVDVKAITTRRKPIYQAFLSQMPPSESSCIKMLGREWPLLRHLRDQMGFPVRDVHFTQSGGSGAYLILSLEKQQPGQVREVAMSAWSYIGGRGKWTVVVDPDIDIRDPFAVEWAMSFRVQPARDILIVDGLPALGLDPATASKKVAQHEGARHLGSKILVDATRKHEYPSPALPPKEHLEKVRADWDSYGIKPS